MEKLSKKSIAKGSWLLGSKHNLFHYFANIVIVFIKNFIFIVFWAVIGIGGFYILEFQNSPYNVVFGLPLMLIGIGFVFHCSSDVFLCIFSRKFNKGTCYFCSPKCE